MLEKIARNRVGSLFLVTFFVLLGVGAVAPGFLTPGTVTIIWSNSSILILVSLGVFPVLLTRNIDVSGGSILGLSAVTLGLSMNAGIALGPAIALSLVTGTAAGALNGVLVAGLGVPSIVATLGTLGLYRGIMLISTGGEWIEVLPNSLKDLANKGSNGVSVLGVLVIVLLIAAWLILRSRRGRWFAAVGDNRDAAKHLGLPVRRIELLAFSFAGLMAALAGVTFAAQIGFVPNQAGTGIELRAIAALVLGGTSLLGGVGSVPGLLIGAIFFTSIDSALVFLKMPAFWNDFIGGGMLLLVLLIDGRLRILLERRDRAARYKRTDAPLNTPAADTKS